MNTKLAALLIVVLAVSFVSQTEAFTAGAGNIGKREYNKLGERLQSMCRVAQFACQQPIKRLVEKAADDQ